MNILGPALAALEAGIGLFASDADYRRPSGGTTTVRAYSRGLRAEELAAAAQQYDHLVTVGAAELQAAGLAPPRRYDEITLMGRKFRVEDWRPAPSSGVPAFYKIHARGGLT